MIEIDRICKRFGATTVINDMSFKVAEGEVLGFLGPNGAGKSTTMKMITGFLAPSSGRITICGKDIGRQTIAAQELMGYLPEGAPCYEDMTVLEYLQFIAQVRGISRTMRPARITSVMDSLALGEVGHQTIDTLSKGFKRRVGLAQAILHDPKVLILDEPTDGLDPNQKHEVRSLINHLASDKIVIISTHILEEVNAVCSRAMIINQGQILVDGSPSELQAMAPKHGNVAIQFFNAAETQLQQYQQQLSTALGLEVSQLHQCEQEITIQQNNPQLYQQVLSYVAQQSWPVRSVNSQQGQLDDVFRQLTKGEQS